MNLRTIGRAAFVGILALYPFAVYFGIQFLPPTFFALLLAVIVMLRGASAKPEERAMVVPLTLLLFVYAVAAAIIGRTQALLYYPVLINSTLCIVFAGSLKTGEPVLLRLVRARGTAIDERARRYLTRLTLIWASFFALNALVALWTTTATLQIWTLYNGLISYVLVGTLGLSEWLYRIHYKRKHGVRD